MLPILTVAAVLLVSACADDDDTRTVITFPGSMLGAEGEILRRQMQRFMELHPDIRVEIQVTPEDATQRHQIFVQRLNARSDDPDVLGIDAIWTPEFAAAGWLLPLDRSGVDTSDFFPATIEPNVWHGRLYAIPWFVDVGMLYWRTDLLDSAPESLDGMVSALVRETSDPEGPPRGIVWQGARYEGLVTVFLEYLGAFGGRIMTEDGRIAVYSDAGIRALEHMRDQIYRYDVAPRAVLTWHEEETRLAFQNGTSVLMRNWPYAYALLESEDSRVQGRFAVAPMPAAPGGRPTAALGGQQLGINAHSNAPEAAFALLQYLAAPERMLERAEVAGQFPPRPSLYDDPRLAAALAIPPDQARRIIEAATPRPVTPIWTQLSGILQIQLHRALVRQTEPAAALRAAARQMEAVIEETGVRQLHAGAAR